MYLMAFHGVVWLCLSAILSVHPDMADHWVWSRYLALGYYEHPPVVAWVMRVFTGWSAWPVWSLKIGAVLFSILNLGLAYLCCKTYTNEQTAWRFCLILEGVVDFSAGSIFWHVDTHYLFFFLLTLYCVGRYINNQKAHWLLLAGVSFGLGMMSKYTIVLLGASLGIWSIWQLPWVWRKPELYLGAALAFLMFLPNLWWNVEHDWISVKFKLAGGLTGGKLGKNWLEFTAGYWFLFSIIFSTHAIWCLVRGKLIIQNAHDKLLLVAAVLPFVFFNISTLKGGAADPHWLNTSFLCLFMLYAKGFAQKPMQLGLLAVLSYSLNMLVLAAFLSHIFFGMFHASLEDSSLDRNSLALVGWQKTATQIEQLLKKNNIAPPPFVISREYQYSSSLALYLNFHPTPHSLERSERNFWSPPKQVEQMGALLVCRPHKCALVFEEEVNPVFENSFDYIGQIKTYAQTRLIRNWNIYHLKPKLLDE